MPHPLISICIPTYNGASFLQEALDSIKTQTYKNIEVVVSDDASTDATLELVEAFKKEGPFPVRAFHHSPSGIGANWNHCLKHAKGEYIKFLFQDDVLLPTCVEEMVAVFQTHKQLGLVASKRDFMVEAESVNEETQKWISNYSDLQKTLHLTEENGVSFMDKSTFKTEGFFEHPYNKIGEPSVFMFKKSLLKKVGYFRNDLKQKLDYEFCYRILKKNPIAIINKPLVKFRIHPQQATQQNIGKTQRDYAIYNKLMYTDYLWYVNAKTRKTLLKKYNRYARFYYKVENKIKKLFK